MQYGFFLSYGFIYYKSSILKLVAKKHKKMLKNTQILLPKKRFWNFFSYFCFDYYIIVFFPISFFEISVSNIGDVGYIIPSSSCC